MTTSIYRNTVSPDLIITTPEQLRQALTIWYQRFEGYPANFDPLGDPTEDGEWGAVYLISILQELNEGVK